MTLRLITRLFITLIATALLAACDAEQGVDGSVSMTLTDIVTFEGNSGSQATYTYRVADDSPLITLTASAPLTTAGISKGDRVVLNYVPQSGAPRTSGPIRVLSAWRITQGSVKEWHADFDPWNQDSVYIYSAWRSGTYINLHVRLTYSAEPRIYALALVPGTGSTAWPELRLVHRLATAADSFQRDYFSSFSIAALWDRPGVKGVKLHVADSNLRRSVFTFPKAQ